MAAETSNISLLQQLENPTLQSLFHALDPVSLILSQNSLTSHQPLPLKLITTETDRAMERGPRYRAYAELRESKLRMKSQRQQQEPEQDTPPPKKQVKFQEKGNSRKGFAALAQSVPDFSATLRKENRKPPLAQELTPPPPSKTLSRANTISSNSRGSKSANSGDQKRNGRGGLMSMMTRKSYASVEELKGLSMAASSAINAENRGGSRAAKTVLGYRQF